MLDATNAVNGLSLNLLAGASLTSVTAALTTAARATYQPSAAGPQAPNVQRLIDEMDVDTTTCPPSRFMSRESIDQHIADYEGILARTTGLSQPQREALRARFIRNLYGSIKLTEKYNGRPPGMVTSQHEGSDFVFYMEGGDAGRTEVGRIPAARLRVLPFLRTALAEATNNPMKIVGIVNAISKVSGLASVLTSVVTGLHWWNYVFIILDVVVDIVSLWVTGGWYLAVVVANLVSSAVQFGITIDQCASKGCFAGNDDAAPALSPALAPA